MMHVERLAHQFVSFAEARRAKLRLSACRRQVEDAGIWFVDIPRTGSTSLKLALAEHFGTEFAKSYLREGHNSGIADRTVAMRVQRILSPPQLWHRIFTRPTKKVIPDNRTAMEAQRILSPELWRRLFTFTIVRNPWDRCFSLFRWRIANKEIPSNFPFSEYLTLLERHNTRHPYTPFLYPTYFMPMCDFIFDGEGKQLLNHIGRFEQREEFMLFLKEKIGVDFSGTRRAEVLGQPGDYRKAYSKEGVEIVARIYQDDIERFGYEF